VIFQSTCDGGERHCGRGEPGFNTLVSGTEFAKQDCQLHSPEAK
jgi:hypothetical protein